MPEHPNSLKSNADRGLERHVDPSNPTAPMLDFCPHPPRGAKSKPPEPAARSKKARHAPTKRAPKKNC